MRAKTKIGILSTLAIILGFVIISFAEKYGGWLFDPTSTPTQTPTSTLESRYMIMCTPPACAIGTSETYYCAGVCNGGCGTTCATYTPLP